jgi:hypothetical protein
VAHKLYGKDPNTDDSRFRHDPEHNYPFGLRPHRYFYANQVYYTAIAIDFVLRFTWVSRLSVRINWINDLESGVFVLMFLEVIRRWMWIFFRVETEWGESSRPFAFFFFFSLIG